MSANILKISHEDIIYYLKIACQIPGILDAIATQKIIAEAAEKAGIEIAIEEGRLIFDNCEFFNEDDSAIGKAGHKLRAFFETKWLKLFD